MKIKYLITAVAFIPLCIMPPAITGDDGRVFNGIDDPKALPMLRYLSYRHGGMNVPKADGRYLYDLIVKHRYRRGLEIGTSNGYSALWLGLAFKKNGGRLVTVEMERERGEEARENFMKAGLDGIIESVIDDALRAIPKIEGTFDFIFIDAWKTDYIKYFRLLRHRMRPGGVITAHNVSGQSRSMADFLEALTSDPGLETKIINTSSEGISVSFVR